MNETRDVLERVGERFDFPDHAFERMLRRRDRRQRNRRVGTIVVALAAAAVAIGGSIEVLRSINSKTATQPGGDGRIVFVAPGNCRPVNRLFTMAPDGTDIKRLVARPNAEYPHWSPDGSKVAFDDGSVVCYRDWRGLPGHIYTVNADGSDLTQVTSGEGVELTPDWSPDGAHLVITAIEPGQPPGIAIVDLATGTIRPLTANPYAGHLDKEPAYAPDGSRIVFVREGSVIEGRHTYDRSALFVVNVDGTGLRRLTPWRRAHVGTPAWSPDGSTIVFSVSSDPSGLPEQIFATGTDGTGMRQLTFGKEWTSLRPSWSPDGTTIVFTRVPLPMGTGGSRLFTMRADGSQLMQLGEPVGTEWTEADWGTHR